MCRPPLTSPRAPRETSPAATTLLFISLFTPVNTPPPRRYFLGLHFDPATANLVSTLYSFGMMPGGIIVGKVSDLFGGRRATVIALFQTLLVPLLWCFALVSEDLPMWAMMVMLCMMGILIGGPNNILTSAVAADLSEHPSIKGNSKSLGTITGIINGSGSITAALGLALVGPMTRTYGWSSVWYFMMALTVCGTGLLMPKVLKEMKKDEVGDEKESSPLLKKVVTYGEAIKV